MLHTRKILLNKNENKEKIYFTSSRNCNGSALPNGLIFFKSSGSTV